MKLDSETVLSRGSVDSKSDQKPVEDNNIAIDLVRLGSENELEGKGENGHFISDLTSKDEEKLRDFVSPIRYSRLSLESESFEKNDSVFYVDKSVMEPELPELVVCYKENTYHVVKDICIDEGIPSKDKFLFDTDVDEEQLCTFLISEDKKGNLDESLKEKRNLDLGHRVSDVLVSSKEKGLENENENSIGHDLNELMPIEKVENGGSREIFSLGELLSMAAKPKSSHIGKDKDEQLAQRPLGNTILTRSHDSEQSENVNEQPSLATPTTVCEAEKSDFCFEEAKTQIPDSEFAAKKSQNGSKEEQPEIHNSDVMSDSNRTNDDTFNNSKLETREGSPNSGTEQFSSQLQYGQGESSFSAAGLVSGLITYSGPIAYSGSLSHRSDSSTTSTRSFAFPILQSEWNSSPVRMAKAERRLNRKHAGWRQAILCCRF